MIRLLVTGQQGQVARSLVYQAKRHPEIEVMAVGRPQLDLENPASVRAAINAARPDIVVNAVAYTAVDKAEQEEAKAFAINRDGAAVVAAACLCVPLIHLSTDYVFSGAKPEPYVESDATCPINVYGKSKLAGEIAVRAAHPSALILRTAWVYSPFGGNFVKTMLRLARARDEISVVDDQTGNPTSALDLADAILRIAPELAAGRNTSPILHLCGSGDATWCGFAREIFAISKSLGGPHAVVHAIRSADYPTLAQRPKNSYLLSAAFHGQFGFQLRPWQEATEETIKQLLLPL